MTTNTSKFLSDLAAKAASGKAIPQRRSTEEIEAAEAVTLAQVAPKDDGAEADFFSQKHDDTSNLCYFHSTSGGSAMVPLPDGNPLAFEHGIFSTADGDAIDTVRSTIKHCAGAIREVSREEALRIVGANMKLTKPFQSFARGAISSGAAKGVKQGNYVEVVAQSRGTEISEFTRTGMAALQEQAESFASPQK